MLAVGNVADGGVAERRLAGGDGFAVSDELARLNISGWSIALQVTGTATTAAILLIGIALGVLPQRGPRAHSAARDER